jgi:hypothetical protein
MATSPPAPVIGANPSLSRVRFTLWLLVPVLILQAAMGIFLNLFVTLPLPANLGVVFPVIFSDPVLSSHFLVGVLLIALAAAAAVFSRGPALRSTRYTAIALALIFAGTAYAGYHFVGTQENSYSFLMEIGFLASIGLLFLLLYLTGALGLRAAEGASRPAGGKTASVPEGSEAPGP